jgi:hypothetical protein
MLFNLDGHHGKIVGIQTWFVSNPNDKSSSTVFKNYIVIKYGPNQ